MKKKWEILVDDTTGDTAGNSLARVRVPGGWIYKLDEWSYAGQPFNTVAIAFAPEKPRRKPKSSKRRK